MKPLRPEEKRHTGSRAARREALLHYASEAADHALLAVLIFSVAAFILLPVGLIAARSVQGEAGLSLSAFRAVLTGYRSSLWHSVFTGVCTALLSTVFSTAAALTICTQRGARRAVLTALLLITMVSPPFVSSLAYIQLYGRNGFVTHGLLGLSLSPYNQWGVIFMQSLSFTPLNALYLRGLVESMDKTALRAARDLGADDGAVLRDMLLPLLRPGIAVSLLLSFVRSLSDFGTPIVIGGRYNTLASDIYLQIVGYADLSKAAAMNVLLLAPSILFFFLYRRLMKGAGRLTRSDGRKEPLSLRLRRCGPAGFLALALSALFNAMMLAQYVCIFLSGFLRSVRGRYHFTGDYWRQFLTYETAPLLRSVLYALITALLGSLLALLLSCYLERRRIPGRSALDFAVTLPYMLPGTCFGLGYLLAFSAPPLKLAGTAAIVILNMLFKQLPTSEKNCAAALTQLPAGMERAARDLGAGPLRVLFGVLLPNLKGAFYSCFVYNFTASMTTAGAILFLIRPAQKVAVFRLFDAVTTGDYAIASLIASVIILTSAAVCAAAQAVVYGREGLRVS